ncbi:glycosyltransferase family 15 protein [Suhomyces tanzawaensis NRRL Y-17324]|uniref:Glycosyltransferase family 15 protein n=1 Tax=Suhomyces tanzawaensis NRRL Y-17324 TaxID=984487 RepID=A0A1E4SLJ5_9ASCO|nr:glycosyltransferase family 15 protein [Suhomyces tanzawaensis NRRL Y-17324]ODV80386.1 glycosyltransferase family 15 protein [Suhomyces tanzawaensis NRRL Y-17324]
MLSLKHSLRWVYLLAACNVIIILAIMVYLDATPLDQEVRLTIRESIQSLTNKFDFTYLKGINKDSKGSAQDTGYTLEPGNVKFKFVNPKAKQGDPKEILEQNTRKYTEVMNQKIAGPKDFDLDLIRAPSDPGTYEHANATIVALVRNSEAIGIGRTIRKFERSFNGKFKYPYTFINDEPFSDKFKKKMQSYSDAPMEFITIPRELWDRPESIDAKKQDELMQIMEDHDVGYAKMLSYHNMCRFYLGNFYLLPELQKYRYYWRIEPNVDFYTDIKYDVFKYMEAKKRIYGFTINLYDIDRSVETLWPETLKFLNKGDNYKYVNKNGAFQWLLDDLQNPRNAKTANGYSTCHFWSNFEIGDMNFFRSEAYMEWFKHLDSTGKFYYERWGDAPVHSIGLALFADKKDIHWFRDIGYSHDPYLNCPHSDDTSGCKTGLLGQWEHLLDQNCMANWIDYSMEDTIGIY